MSANIRVDEALNEKLKKLKEEWKLPSVSAVMEKLLEDREDPASSNGEEEVASDSHSAEQKPEKAGQFLDYETLKREARAVKYFTGLNEKCMKWVEKELLSAVGAFFFFFGHFALEPAHGPELLFSPAFLLHLSCFVIDRSCTACGGCQTAQK